MNTTKDVLDRHLKCFAARDLKGILTGYALDAVLFSPHGVARGAKAIRIFFRAVLSEFDSMGASFEVEQQSVEGEHGYIRWCAKTVGDDCLMGCDTFAVQDRKIVVHSFTAKLAFSADRLNEVAMARELSGILRSGRAADDRKAYATELEWAGAGGIR